LKIKLDENLGRRTPSKRRGAIKTLKERLLEMPSVGDDKDFVRRRDVGRRTESRRKPQR
jgi:hypothetical protein